MIKEFKEDIGKIIIILMGLPGAGKSTFINTEIHKYIPGFFGYKTISSDIQLESIQFKTAIIHYNWLLTNVKTTLDIDKFISDTQYISNSGKIIQHPITYDWWINNKKLGLKHYYQAFKRGFYATYFDIRDLAKESAKNIFATKIMTSSRLIIIDTVGAYPLRIFDKIKQAKELGFSSIIIYLDIDTELCIERDKFRGKYGSGRTVGEKTILDYATNMNNAFETYILDGKSDEGIVDRLMHFNWIPLGDDPRLGNWKKLSDFRFGLHRKIKKLKQR